MNRFSTDRKKYPDNRAAASVPTASAEDSQEEGIRAILDAAFGGPETDVSPVEENKDENCGETEVWNKTPREPDASELAQLPVYAGPEPTEEEDEKDPFRHSSDYEHLVL